MKRSLTLVTLSLLFLVSADSLRADFLNSGQSRLVNDDLLLTNITYRATGGRILALAHPIFIEFQFLADRNHSVSVHPLSAGEPTPGGTTSNVPITRMQGFAVMTVTVTSGHALVDGIQFVVSDNLGREIDRFILRVTSRYLYGDYSPRFTHVRFDKTFTACLPLGSTAPVEIDYRAPEKVEILVVPLTNGDYSPGATGSRDTGQMGFGAVTGDYGVTGEPAIVDAIRLIMKSVATGEILREADISVDHHFGDCEPQLSNGYLVQSSPACIPPDWSVEARFDYRSLQPSYVVATPTFGGVAVAGAQSPRVNLSAGVAGGTATFTFSRQYVEDFGAAVVDGVRLQMFSVNGKLLDELELPGQFRFDHGSCHTIEAVRIEPTTRGCLDVGDEVTVDVDFWAPGPIRIDVSPTLGGEPVQGVTTTDVLPGGAGTTTISFPIASKGDVDGIRVRVWNAGLNGVLAETLVEVSLQVPCGGVFPNPRPIPLPIPVPAPVPNGPTFRRGDVNGDGRMDISDAISNLDYQFSGTFDPPCLDAVDVDDNGKLEITDPILQLNYLFGGEVVEIPAPGPRRCGVDPTLDSKFPQLELSCKSYGGCG